MSDGRRTLNSGTWIGSLVTGGSVLILAVLALALVPDWLVERALADSSLLGDVVMIAWATGAVVGLAWLVVRLQPGGRR